MHANIRHSLHQSEVTAGKSLSIKGSASPVNQIQGGKPSKLESQECQYFRLFIVYFIGPFYQICGERLLVWEINNKSQLFFSLLQISKITSTYSDCGAITGPSHEL
jgi:hypothetical protein